MTASGAPAGSSFARRARVVLTYVGFGVGVALLAAWLTPPVYQAIVDLGLREPKPGEEQAFFLKVFRRLLLIPLVLGFLVMLKPWRDGNLASYGLTRSKGALRHFLRGWTGSFVLVVSVLAIHRIVGWLVWEDPIEWGQVAKRVVHYLPAGVLIAALEGWFFRGWMIRRLSRSYGLAPAVGFSALLFGVLHAFRANRVEQEISLDFGGAMEALGAWLQHLFDMQTFGPVCLGLILFALVLTAAYVRTGTLWGSIGIHAAGVFVIYTYGALTDRYPNRTWAGGKLLYDGWPVWILLAVLFLVIWPWGRDVMPVIRGDARRDADPDDGGDAA